MGRGTDEWRGTDEGGGQRGEGDRGGRGTEGGEGQMREGDRGGEAAEEVREWRDSLDGISVQ